MCYCVGDICSNNTYYLFCKYTNIFSILMYILKKIISHGVVNESRDGKKQGD